jgi:hypothetical protein
MTPLRPSFWSTHKRTILGLVFGLAFSAALAYAAPPGSQYSAGATLDPACVPGSSNCTVDIDGPINYVGTSYIGNTSGPSSNGSNGGTANNIFIGNSVATDGTTVSNSIAIGAYADTGGFSNSIILGSGTSGVPIANTAANQFMLAPSITTARFRGINYTFPSAQAGGAGYVLINNGAGVLSWGAQSGGGGAISLLTNGVANGSQTALNLANGSNISITDDGSGNVTISSSVPSVDTIYTADGILSGSRTVDLGGNDLNFADPGSGNRVGMYFDTAGFLSNLGSVPGDGFAYVQVDNNSDLITLKAGTLNIPTGASDGFVLTSDGSGNASWQAAPGTPITIQNTNSLFSTALTGTGTGSTATHSLFLLEDAGSSATNASNSIFVGQDAGNGATNAANSIFLGQNAGSGSTIDTTGNANDFSILIGKDSSNGNFKNSIAIGVGATNNAQNQLVIGSATRPISSIFIGGGQETTGVQDGVVAIGSYAGASVTTAYSAVFIGNGAGISATNGAATTAIGGGAGYVAGNIGESTFIGANSGFASTDSARSVFIGTQSGGNNSNNLGTRRAPRSIMIGWHAGYGAGDYSGLDNTTNSDDYSILIGTSTSTGGFENSIALGYQATNTATNQFMVGSNGRRIENLVFNGGTGNTCSIAASTGITCSSDERLKTNIQDLDTNTLEKVLNLRTVSYNWNSDPNGKSMIGFIAQNLQPQFPELITTNIDGMLSVNYAQMTPILVEAIREINLKITGIADLDIENSWRTALVNWFASASNGIGEFFAKKIHTDTICVKKSDGSELCLDGDQLQSALGSTTILITPTPAPTPEVPPTEETAPEEGTQETPVVESTPETPSPDPVPTESPNPEISTEQ